MAKNVTEEDQLAEKDAFLEPAFWEEQIGNAESNEFRRDWLKAGEQAQSLLSRRMGPKNKQRDDPCDATAALAWAMIGEMIYRDPTPTVHNWRSSGELLAPIWKRLLEYTMGEREQLHQTNALLFLAHGLSGVKILPAGPVPVMYRVDGKNLIFDAKYLKSGGNPFETAYFIGEVIEKRLSDILRNGAYDKEMREEVVRQELSGQRLPAELAVTKIYELHARRATGRWHVFTWHKHAKRRLLQNGREPIGTPPYAFWQQPGARGLETGPLSRISNLDEEFNKVFKRALERSGQRSDVLVHTKGITQRGSTVPGKGHSKSKAEMAFQAGKEGIAQLAVDGDANKAMAHYTIGQMTADDMRELDFLLFKMMWQLGSSPQALSGAGAEKTATEINFVELMRRQRAGVTERLVDSYFDRQAHVMARTLKWMVDRAERHPKYLDLFSHALASEKDYSLFMAMVPTFSDDLSEFKFGIEAGSTRRMRDTILVEVFDRLLQMLEPLNQIAAAGGERIVLQPLLKPFLRALDLPINVEDMFAPLPPQAMEGGNDDTQQPGGGAREQIARLLGGVSDIGRAGDIPMGRQEAGMGEGF